MAKDLTGQKFGLLTVIGKSEDYYIRKNGKRETLWECICDCGNDQIRKVLGYQLKNGNIYCCGCLTKEKLRQRGYELKQKYKDSNKKYNKYNLSNNYGIGYTSNTNKEFYFDLEDYDKIKNHYWYEDANGYIVAHSLEDDNIKKTNIYLHRFVLNITNNNIFVDHIGHIKNDNRKSNLRVLNPQENTYNRGIQSNNTSGITGVYFHKPSNSWCAYIKISGHQIKRYSKNKEEAIKLRIDLENKYFGEYSYNNSIKIYEDNINE